jgi:hypothetical protein
MINSTRIAYYRNVTVSGTFGWTVSYLHGPFNYNRMPLAPLCTKAITHNKPDQRGSWATHGGAGWYVGHAPNITDATKTMSPRPVESK